MKKVDYLKKLLGYLDNPDPNALALSMKDVHHSGVFSLVINGTEFGSLTRVFITTEDIEPFAVQLHSHRYPVKITALTCGIVNHHAFYDYSVRSLSLSKFSYKSPLNGGKGLSYLREANLKIDSISLPQGASFNMGISDVHTMSAKKDSMWVVEEGGFGTTSSIVFGVPFVVDKLYNKCEGFQINDHWQKVRRKLKEMIINYELV